MKNISIAGRLTKDAELKQQGDSSITTFSVAVDHRDRKDGKWEKSTMYFDAAIFGRRGETLCQYLTKGTPVAVSGEFSARIYRKKNGSAGLSLRVHANEVTLLGGRRDDGGGGRYGGQGGSRGASGVDHAPAEVDGEFDDIPF